MFWTGFLSIIRSLVLYTQQQAYTYSCVYDTVLDT